MQNMSSSSTPIFIDAAGNYQLAQIIPTVTPVDPADVIIQRIRDRTITADEIWSEVIKFLTPKPSPAGPTAVEAAQIAERWAVQLLEASRKKHADRMNGAVNTSSVSYPQGSLMRELFSPTIQSFDFSNAPVEPSRADDTSAMDLTEVDSSSNIGSTMDRSHSSGSSSPLSSPSNAPSTPPSFAPPDNVLYHQCASISNSASVMTPSPMDLDGPIDVESTANFAYPETPATPGQAKGISWPMVQEDASWYHFNALNDDPRVWDGNNVHSTPMNIGTQDQCFVPASMFTPFNDPFNIPLSPIPPLFLNDPWGEDDSTMYLGRMSPDPLRLDESNLPAPYYDSAPEDSDDEDVTLVDSDTDVKQSPWVGRLRARKVRSALVIARRASGNRKNASIKQESSILKSLESSLPKSLESSAPVAGFCREWSPMSDLTELESETEDEEDDSAHEEFVSRARRIVERLGSSKVKKEPIPLTMSLRSGRKSRLPSKYDNFETSSPIARNTRYALKKRAETSKPYARKASTSPKKSPVLKAIGNPSSLRKNIYANDMEIFECIATQPAGSDLVCPVEGCALTIPVSRSSSLNYRRHLLSHSRISEILCVCKDTEGDAMRYTRFDSIQRHASTTNDKRCKARAREAKKEHEAFIKMVHALKKAINKYGSSSTGEVQKILKEMFDFCRECQERVSGRL